MGYPKHLYKEKYKKQLTDGYSEDYKILLNPEKKIENNFEHKNVEEWSEDNTISWFIQNAIQKKFYEIPLSNFHMLGEELMKLKFCHFINKMRHPGVDSSKSEEMGSWFYNILDNISERSVKVEHRDYKNCNLKTPNVKVNNDSLRGITFKNKKVQERVRRRRKPAAIVEFLKNLLLDEKCCPSEIMWEDYSQRMFRIVDLNAVVQRWNQKKNNSKQCSDVQHFHRAIRYHYDKGSISRVEGKRSVLKFGPKAPDCTTDDPNFIKAKRNCQFDELDVYEQKFSPEYIECYRSI